MITRLISLSRYLGKSSSVLDCVDSIAATRKRHAKLIIPKYNSICQLPYGPSAYLHDTLPQYTCFSTAIHPKGHSSCEILLSKLESSLKHHQIAEAWETFTNFKRLHGFPNKVLVRRLVIQLSYSSEPCWLRKAYCLVLLIMKEKSDLLHYDFLARLTISLARKQMPVPASTVLRSMLQLGKFPPMDLWRVIFLHMVKTEIGTYLASDILVEICDCFLRYVGDHGTKNTKHLKLIKPDTTIFNLVLDACVRFGSTLKAQQIVELMPTIGIVADACTIVVIARIHEVNGQRDELKKLRDFINQVPPQLVRHYRQFYDSLLSLHFKFNDIDAAAELIFDMYSCHGLFLSTGGLNPQNRNDVRRPHTITIGSCNLKTGLRLQIEPELLQKDFILTAGGHQEMVIFKDGKLVPTHNAIAKFMSDCQRHGKVGELSKLLVKIKTVPGVSEYAGLSLDVVGACIELGWLEITHDILDDMELSGTPMDYIAYLSLLRAYCKGNMLDNAKVLMKQMRKVGWFKNLSDKEVISKCRLQEGSLVSHETKSVALVGNSALVESLVREMSEGAKSISQLVYEINSSIYFFCKGNMMEDALKTYRRMQDRGIQPTVQTFANLVSGYSSLTMYREITILWGEIRRKMDSGDLTADRDLHEMLLWNFIQGGYFERVMEVLEYMKRHNMYTDKWKYKKEFLKLHKHLYRRLKAEDAKTEAQVKRLEHVQAFRKWLSTG